MFLDMCYPLLSKKVLLWLKSNSNKQTVLRQSAFMMIPSFLRIIKSVICSHCFRDVIGVKQNLCNGNGKEILWNAESLKCLKWIEPVTVSSLGIFQLSSKSDVDLSIVVWTISGYSPPARTARIFSGGVPDPVSDNIHSRPFVYLPLSYLRLLKVALKSLLKHGCLWLVISKV